MLNWEVEQWSGIELGTRRESVSPVLSTFDDLD
jgi:hypothetical protein